MAANSTIILQSCDDKQFIVDINIASKSQTIKTMLEDLGCGDSGEPVPLPNVSGEVLEKVLEWCEHHKDDAPVVEDDNAEKRTDDINDWDKKFTDVDQRLLFSIILAANYLDIKGLLDLSCKTVANLIKGKTPEEIRKTFRLEENKSPEKPDSSKEGHN